MCRRDSVFNSCQCPLWWMFPLRWWQQWNPAHYLSSQNLFLKTGWEYVVEVCGGIVPRQSSSSCTVVEVHQWSILALGMTSWCNGSLSCHCARWCAIEPLRSISSSVHWLMVFTLQYHKNYKMYNIVKDLCAAPLLGYTTSRFCCSAIGLVN